MKATGILQKMVSRYDPLTGEVSYMLDLDGIIVAMNELIGHSVSFQFEGEIRCIHCGRKIKKTFAQGYCYPCFTTLPETDRCILHPELCQAHLGISRDMEWSREHCLQDHFVYLAYTSGVKVGVTRASQVPYRWIDQGAVAALRIARTPYRHLAGTIEVFLKQYLNDKTRWKTMLGNTAPPIEMLENERKRITELLRKEKTYEKYLFHDPSPTILKYPVNLYPEYIRSVSLDKQPSLEGTLAGIKGQYLIFRSGEVINIRKHGGYVITLTTS